MAEDDLPTIESITKEIKECLIDVIRPTIQDDGGDLEFISWDPSSRIVTIALKGACVGCPHSSVTLKHGIEAFLQEMFPGLVEQVVNQECNDAHL